MLMVNTKVIVHIVDIHYTIKVTKGYIFMLNNKIHV